MKNTSVYMKVNASFIYQRTAATRYGPSASEHHMKWRLQPRKGARSTTGCGLAEEEGQGVGEQGSTGTPYNIQTVCQS